MDKSPQLSDYSFETEPLPKQATRVLHPFIFLRRHDMAVLVPAVMLTCGCAAVPTGLTLLFGRVFDKLQLFSQGDQPHGFLRELCLACFSISLLGVGASIVLCFQLYFWMQVGERQQCRARRLLVGSLLSRDMAFFEANRDLNGDVVQVNRCIEELRKATSECSSVILISVLSIGALAGVSFGNSWSLTLVTLSSLPLIGGLALFFGRLYLRFSDTENAHSTLVARTVDWALMSPVILKTFNSQADELDRFTREVASCKSAFLWASFHEAANEAALRILGLMMCVQAFWYGSIQIRRGFLTSGQVVSCFYACLSITETLHNLTGQLAVFQKAILSVRRIVALIGVRSLDKDFDFDSNGKSYPAFAPRGRIIFHGVSFAYPARQHTPVLSNVTVTIPDGRTTYVVGRSGSGKSTLSALLMGLYTPTQGYITVDGMDVARVDTRWLTDYIALVQQDGTLFSGSVVENITLGRDVPAHRLASVLEMCNLRDVVTRLGDSSVGTGGVALSGGQRQRVALARALLRDPQVLILDESVSALEVRQQDAVLRNIKRLRAGRTTIILTHEYSTIAPDDLVCCMESGRVTEMGTKFDLLVRGGRFASLSVPVSATLEPTFVQMPPRPTEYQAKLRQSVLPFAFELPVPDVEAQLPQLASVVAILAGLEWLQSPVFVILGVFCAVVNGVCSPAFSFCFARLLAGVVPSEAGIGSDAYLRRWSLAVVAVVVTDGLTTFGKHFCLAYAAEKWTEHLRVRVFANVLKQDTAWFDAQADRTGALSALLVNDTRDLRVLLSELPDILTSFVLSLAVSTVWALVCGWKLALVALAFVPLFVIAAGAYSGLLQRSEQRYRDQVERIETMLHELVDGVATVKGLGLCGFFFKRSLAALAQLRTVGSLRALHTGIGLAVASLVMYIAQGLLLYYGLRLAVTGEYTLVQTMEVFSLMVFGLAASVRAIAQIPDVSRAKRAGTKLLALAQLQPSRTEVAGYARPRISVRPGANLVHIQGLRFSYGPKPVLRGLSLDIEQAETVAIVGASGSGKSTVLALISRLYGVADNRIFLSGFDINAFQVGFLRALIAYVPQKTVFFNGSIRDNLVYGLPVGMSCYDTEIYTVLDMLDMKAFVQSLPDRLDSPIGDSSNVLLSGGQAQRLAIARAVLRRPRLLILDECTASLDPVSAERISRFVQALNSRPDVTTVVVTHSVELMRCAERCIVLKDGRVAETGSYDELMRVQGELYRLTTNISR